jgi:hypothetical protein
MSRALIDVACVAAGMLWMVRAGTHYKVLTRRSGLRKCAACGRRLPCRCHDAG